eukprot:8535-Amphidinium_carterae.1
MSCCSVLQWLWQLSALEQKPSVPSRTMLTMVRKRILTSKREPRPVGCTHRDLSTRAWVTGLSSTVLARVTGGDLAWPARL